MSIKSNINKIHFDLLEEFGDVKMFEKSNTKLGIYFEIEIKESNKLIRALISKKDLEKNSFDWSYYSNPNDFNSHLVERNSGIVDFTKTIKDIFEKDRFDSEYLKSLNN